MYRNLFNTTHIHTLLYYKIRKQIHSTQGGTYERGIKKTFEVINVKCDGCASTLKASLKEEFGEAEVNLNVKPRQITLDIEDSAIPTLRAKLKSLGYPMSDEDLSKFEGFTTSAKSFVSCAVGKMNS